MGDNGINMDRPTDEIIKTIYKDKNLEQTVQLIHEKDNFVTTDYVLNIIAASLLKVGLDDDGKLDIKKVTDHISSLDKFGYTPTNQEIIANKHAIDLLKNRSDAFFKNMRNIDTNSRLFNFGNFLINLPKTLLVTSLRFAIRAIPLACAAICATVVAAGCAFINLINTVTC
tara:strand:- start:402 stop:914 length:513 start_codon:yes stop_codon:yes gene_type:complete